jgi:toxin ParE1/3/4
MEVRWSPSARRDLEQIRSYIGFDSPEYARRMVERIINAVERVSALPESGSMLPEKERPELRQIFVANYRIIYRSHPQVLEVVLVLHGARRFPEELSS